MARWDGASRAPGPRLEGDRVEGSGHFGFGDHEAESPRDDPILSQPCSSVQVGNRGWALTVWWLEGAEPSQLGWRTQAH